MIGPYADTNRNERGLNSTEVTLPELLREAGYRTGMSGKWHLGHHVDFIDDAVAGNQPFFLYFSPHTPHVPIHPHPDYLSVVGQTDPVARYYDLIKEIDARVGEILDRLALHGIENNTLVIFTSDNGPSQSSRRVQANEVRLA